MKNKLVILCFVFCFFACSQQPKETVQENESIITTIDSLTNAWHRTASASKITPYLDAMDSVSVFIGTDISKIWNKQDFTTFASPYFAQGKGWDFEVLKRNCYVAEKKNVVWFDETLNTWMGLCRGSGVWEKTKESWKLKQYVLSVAIPNETIQAVLTAKRSSDSIYLKMKNTQPKFRK